VKDVAASFSKNIVLEM